jgi:hypothetical protein
VALDFPITLTATVQEPALVAVSCLSVSQVTLVTATATATAAVPATTSTPTTVAATAATVAAPATTATTVAAAATTATTTTAVFAGLGFVHGQGPATDEGAVHCCDCFIRPVGHLDECEAPAPPGLPVGHHLGTGHTTILAERLNEIVARGLERDVPDVKFLAHGLLS